MRASNLKARLAEVMEERDLRQTDVVAAAEKYRKAHPEYQDVELRRNDISQYLSKEIEPKPDKLRLLANTLGVTSDWLQGYNCPKSALEQILHSLGVSVSEGSEQVCLSGFNESVGYLLKYTRPRWDALVRAGDAKAVFQDMLLAAAGRADSNGVSSAAARAAVLYDRADTRDRQIVDTILGGYSA